MKMSALATSIVLTSLVLGFGACAGSETGNGGPEQRPSPIWFELDAGPERLPGDPVEAHDAGGAFFRVWSVVGHIEAVDFVKRGERNVTAEGSWQVDLIDGELVPDFALPGDVAPEEVFLIRVRWGAPSGPTLVIRGELTLPGESEPRPFGLDLDVKLTSAFTVGGSQQAGGGWALTIDPSRWFEESDVTACVRSGLVPVDAQGLLRLGLAERQCRAASVRFATGFRLDGVAARRP